MRLLQFIARLLLFKETMIIMFNYKTLPPHSTWLFPYLPNATSLDVSCLQHFDWHIPLTMLKPKCQGYAFQSVLFSHFVFGFWKKSFPPKGMMIIIQAHFISCPIYILDCNLHKCDGIIVSPIWIPNNWASLLRLLYLAIRYSLAFALMINNVISE